MAQTRIRIAEQLQTSTSARSILITDASSKPSYFAPTTGADTILFWDDSAAAWSPLTIGTNLSISGTTLNASAGAGGYAEIQEEGTPVTARSKMNFIGTGITATDNVGNTRTDITLATFLNTLATSGSVNLASHVSGDLPFANLTQIAGLSVLGVSGNATADVAAITAASDGQVLRRSGTTIGFGALNLADNTNAVTGILDETNGGTGLSSYILGDTIYGSAANTLSKLSGNITTTKMYLSQTGNGSTSAAPAWAQIAEADIADGSIFPRLNATETISGSWTFSNNITLNGTMTLGTDAVNVNYVTNALAGFKGMRSVRVATTGVLTISARTSTMLSVGGTTLTIDGISLANNDIVLVKDGTTGAAGAGNADNGKYSVSGIGSSVILTRTTDMDTAAETDGHLVLVEDGTANVGTLWSQTAEVTTLGTDTITWVNFNKATDIVAGAGLAFSGLTLNIAAADTSITVNADNIQVALNGTASGLEVSSGLRIKSDITTANTIGVTITSNGAGIKFDSNSFADSGSETLALASGVAGNGLALTTGVLSVNVDNSTIEITTDSLNVKNSGITYAKIQNMTTDRLLGRDTAGTGVVEEVSVTNGLAFTGSTSIGHSTTGATSVTHTNAQVPSVVTIDSWGHVTGFTTRNLNLSNLADVTITSPSNTQVLTYNGSAWVNSAPSGGGGTTVRAFIESSTSSTIDLDANTGVVKDKDGNNVAFTVPSDTLKFFVYRNGIRQNETGGAPGNTTRDYSVNTTTHVLTLTYALTSDEVLMVEKLA